MKNLVVLPDRLMPWEDAEAFATLHAEMLEEYSPRGPMERHLVNELSGCMWRMKRVAVAEGALQQLGISNATEDSYGSGSIKKRAIAHLKSNEVRNSALV